MLSDMGLKRKYATTQVDFYPVILPCGGEVVLVVMSMPICESLGLGVHLKSYTTEYPNIADEIDNFRCVPGLYKFRIHGAENGTAEFIEKRLLARTGTSLYQPTANEV